MASNYNSVSRLLNICEAMISTQNGAALMTAWADVFGIENVDGHLLQFMVAERLCALNEELKRAQIELEASGSFGADLYLPPINSARDAFSPVNLHSDNSRIRAILMADVRTPFRYMRSGLASEEQEFSAADLLELNELIAELQQVVENSNLSPQVLNLVRNHIALLLRALSLYPIKGPAALVDALKSMAVELHLNRDVIRENQESPEIGLVLRSWNKAQAMMLALSNRPDIVAIAALGFEVVKTLK